MSRILRSIHASDFNEIVANLGEVGRKDIEWSEHIAPPKDAEEFALSAILVICNSGMKNSIAEEIYKKCRSAIKTGKSAATVFGHRGKAQAINDIWTNRQDIFENFLKATDKIAFCETLPWIGGITKYHLAKTYGVDCAKPDLHMQRLADREECSVEVLCKRLAGETGYRVATIDEILWRACVTGVLDSKTGTLSVPKGPIRGPAPD